MPMEMITEESPYGFKEEWVRTQQQHGRKKTIPTSQIYAPKAKVKNMNSLNGISSSARI